MAPIVYWALKEMGLNYKYELIENPKILDEMGITQTPAMMINGKVVLAGRIPSGAEIINILEKELKKIKVSMNKEI